MDYDKIFLRPLKGLLEAQPKDVIERLTIEAMTRHRYLVGEAQIAYHRFKNGIEDLEKSDGEEAYLSSMIAVHAQQTVVSTMFDLLGYIPQTMPGRTTN